MSDLFTKSPLLENSKRRNGALPGRYRLQVRCLTGELRDCLDETVSMRLARVFAEAQSKKLRHSIPQEFERNNWKVL